MSEREYIATYKATVIDGKIYDNLIGISFDKEIVRCENCEWFEKGKRMEDGFDGDGACTLLKQDRSLRDFCSYGERKES